MGRLEGTGRPAFLFLRLKDEQGAKKELEQVVTESPALAVLAQASSRMQTGSERETGKGQQTDRGGRVFCCRRQGSLRVLPGGQKAKAS
jgi:hypothetical protein